jgi:hypothetical protein
MESNLYIQFRMIVFGGYFTTGKAAEDEIS